MGRAPEFLRRHWWLLILIAIVAFGFYVRTGAMRYSDLPDIDTYYFVRINEYVLSHNFQMPAADTMRNWPYGERFFDLPVNFYLPSAMYAALNPALNMTFYRFAFIEPVILAAIGIFIFYFLAKELFGCRLKSLIATFFFATLPAAITRLSSGEIEKEANSLMFMLLSLLFFFRSYKSGWKWKGLAYGILSGIFLGLTGITWGGVQVIYIIISLFALVMLLINRPQGLWHSFIPMAAIAMAIQLTIAPQFTPPTGYNIILAEFVIALIIVREAAAKFKLVKEEALKFVTPGFLVLSFVGTLIASMFSDFVAEMLTRLWLMVTLVQPTLTTVAESIPGDWNSVVSQSGVAFSQGALPQLHWAGALASLSPSVLLSAWFLMLLGIILIAYKFARYREYLPAFVLIFALFSVFGTFYALRLAYFLGFSASLAAGFFAGWFLLRLRQIRTLRAVRPTSLLYLAVAGFCVVAFLLTLSTPVFSLSMLAIAICLAVPGLAMRAASHDSWMKRLWARLSRNSESWPDAAMILAAVFAVLLVAANTANALSFGSQLGPSINPYINEAMKFMREQTPENTSLLSWWDFGYWFQYVGKRATIVDGGGSGDTSRFEVATWFTDDTRNWSRWLPWLNNKLDVGYILMDYTLPGKYGAISKIASHETTVVGMLQFEQSGATQQGNTTIQEFGAGQYRIWIPLTSAGGIAGTPVFLITDGTRYANRAYINDLCTENGIISVGNESQTIGGCIAMAPFGMFYIPAEAEHTIFTSLMFMDGAGLTGLEKVFDNGLLHIFDLRGTTH